MNWTVRRVTDAELTLEMVGSALLTTEADPDRARRGYDVALRGTLRYDRAKKAIARLDIVAVGDHWGRSTYTPGERPGRKPLGVSFELVPGDRPDQRIPPQAAREVGAYFAR